MRQIGGFWHYGNLVDHFAYLANKFNIDESEFQFVVYDNLKEGDKIYMELWQDEGTFLGYIITRGVVAIRGIKSRK